MKQLYLGSTSASRRMLLTQARIPFTVIQQSADESQCDWQLSLQQVVENIALYKMKHLLLPPAEKDAICYVLTADTLTENSQGKLEGKPIDRADAIQKIRFARNGVRTGTAFCLDQRIYDGQHWQIEKRVVQFVQAAYIFNVPDHYIDFYLDNVGMYGSCAIAIEDIGAQFLQSLNGSYTAVVGLPMYELRQALEKMNFFN
jgi:septum formation protein